MCKLKNQSEEVFVLAFGYARYAFQRYRNDVYRLLPRAEAKKYIGHGAPSQKLFFTDNREAHRIFREMCIRDSRPSTSMNKPLRKQRLIANFIAAAELLSLVLKHTRPCFTAAKRTSFTS